jgi:hypothetical protein
MIEEWKASAKNLIYHFRCVLKAMVPFALSWTPQKQKHANLDNESLSYIKTMAALIDARSKLERSYRNLMHFLEFC